MARTSMATDALSKEEEDKKKAAKKDKKVDAAKGGATLAASVIGGPVGGAIAGVAGGLVDANRADKKREPGRPEFRNQAKIAQGIKSGQKKKQNALAALSAAMSDWSSRSR